MSDAFDLDAILARSQRAYSEAVDQFIDGDGTPTVIREHFNYDVPALIGAVKRLTAELEKRGQE